MSRKIGFLKDFRVDDFGPGKGHGFVIFFRTSDSKFLNPSPQRLPESCKAGRTIIHFMILLLASSFQVLFEVPAWKYFCRMRDKDFCGYVIKGRLRKGRERHQADENRRLLPKAYQSMGRKPVPVSGGYSAFPVGYGLLRAGRIDETELTHITQEIIG